MRQRSRSRQPLSRQFLSRQFVSRQFGLFVLTGGTAAVVNFGSRIVYNQWMGFSAAIILAYITGMITAFVLAKLFVFKESQQSLQKDAKHQARVTASGSACRNAARFTF